MWSQSSQRLPVHAAQSVGQPVLAELQLCMHRNNNVSARLSWDSRPFNYVTLICRVYILCIKLTFHDSFMLLIFTSKQKYCFNYCMLIISAYIYLGVFEKAASPSGVLGCKHHRDWENTS